MLTALIKSQNSLNMIMFPIISNSIDIHIHSTYYYNTVIQYTDKSAYVKYRWWFVM